MARLVAFSKPCLCPEGAEVNSPGSSAAAPGVSRDAETISTDNPSARRGRAPAGGWIRDDFLRSPVTQGVASLCPGLFTECPFRAQNPVSNSKLDEPSENEKPLDDLRPRIHTRKSSHTLLCKRAGMTLTDLAILFIDKAQGA